VAVSFIGGFNWSTLRKPPTGRNLSSCNYIQEADEAEGNNVYALYENLIYSMSMNRHICGEYDHS
jgi:hypothetical protein